LDSLFLRLLKYDTNSTLTTAEILELGRNIVRLGSSSPVSRQVMKSLLSNMKRIDLVGFLPMLSDLNTKFDEKKIGKIFAKNRTNLMEYLDEIKLPSVAISLSRLWIFDTEIFCEKIWSISTPGRDLLEAIAIEYLSGENSQFIQLVNSNKSQILSWLDSLGESNISTTVRLMMISLEMPMNFTSPIPDQFQSMDSVIVSPISPTLVLIHIESFAEWLARGRPIGQSLIHSFKDISRKDFVAIEILDAENDFYVDEKIATMNRPAAIRHRFVSSNFVRIAPANSGTDLVQHTIQELAKLDSH
jgi:hypothetical protein